MFRVLDFFRLHADNYNNGREQLEIGELEDSDGDKVWQKMATAR